MSSFKRFLLLLSIGVFLLAGLMVTSQTWVSSTAFASSCNPASYSWSNNCQISEGNISNYVYAIQVAINESPVRCGTLTVDGDFGSKTFAAVECFQSKEKISVDGIVGQQTWGALFNTLSGPLYSSGWDYYYGFVGSKNALGDFRMWDSSGTWYVYTGSKWCQMNLSSPC